MRDALKPPPLPPASSAHANAIGATRLPSVKSLPMPQPPMAMSASENLGGSQRDMRKLDPAAASHARTQLIQSSTEPPPVAATMTQTAP